MIYGTKQQCYRTLTSRCSAIEQIFDMDFLVGGTTDHPTTGDVVARNQQILNDCLSLLPLSALLLDLVKDEHQERDTSRVQQYIARAEISPQDG